MNCLRQTIGISYSYRVLNCCCLIWKSVPQHMMHITSAPPLTICKYCTSSVMASLWLYARNEKLLLSLQLMWSDSKQFSTYKHIPSHCFSTQIFIIYSLCVSMTTEIHCSTSAGNKTSQQLLFINKVFITINHKIPVTATTP